MNTPPPSASAYDPIDDDAARACDALWVAMLMARGIVCDDAQRERMATASPYLVQIKRRLQTWRAQAELFDQRFEGAPHRDD